MERIIKMVQETLLYLWMVFVETWKAIERWTGIMRIILGLFLLFIILSCLMLFSLAMGFPSGIEQLINDFSSEIRIDSTRLAFYLFIASLVFPILFLRQAAKIHEMQEDDKRKLRRRINELETKPMVQDIIITSFNPNTIKQDKVGIDIKNPNSEKFVDGVIELVGLVWWVTDDWMNYHPMNFDLSNNRDNCHFKASTINHDDHIVVYLAEMQGERFVFLTERGLSFDNNINLVSRENNEYALTYFEVTFEVKGKVKDTLLIERYNTRINFTTIKRYSISERTDTPKIDNAIGIGAVIHEQRSPD